MTRRDWWLVSAGTCITGALVGALAHSALLVAWNMIWLGVAIHMVQKLGGEHGN